MKLIILECDGVVSQRLENEIKDPQDWLPVAGIVKAMGRLCQSGYTLALITNQPANGQVLTMLHAIYNRLSHMLESYGGHIDAIFFSPHETKESCECRKPGSGIYSEIEKRFHCELHNVPVVSNNLDDLESIKFSGASHVLVKTGMEENLLSDIDAGLITTMAVYNDLAEFAEAIILETDK